MRTRTSATSDHRRALLHGPAVAWLTVDGHLTGAVLLRPDASRTLRHLRTAGIQRLLMLTGDRAAPTHEVAAVLGWTTHAPNSARLTRSRPYSRTLGGPEATATMSRAHPDLGRLSRRTATHLQLARTDGGLAPE